MRPIVYLEIVGPENAPRYMIVTSTGRYWNGREWKRGKKDGKLYVNGMEASNETLRLQKENYKDCKHRTVFTVPIELEVFSENLVPYEVLRVWLQRAIATNIAYGTFGNGPINDSIVLAAVNFNHLKEKVHEPSTDREN